MPLSASRMQEAGVPLENEEIIIWQCDRVIELMDAKGIPWLPGVPELFDEIAAAGAQLRGKG